MRHDKDDLQAAPSCRLARLHLGAVLLASAGMAHAAPDARDEQHLQRWIAEQKQESAVAAFGEHLRQQGVRDVVPLHQLLRTASDWNEPACKAIEAPPFEVPERTKWAQTVKTLKFLRLLRDQQVLPQFEVVSAYRNEAVDKCAQGKGSRHPTAGAFDLLIPPGERPAAVERLCTFFWKHGSKHRMGFSQYQSGRLHIDTVRYGTWGDDGHIGTSVCRRGP